METTTAIQTIDTQQVATVMGGASAVIERNRQSVENADKASQGILDTIEAAGLLNINGQPLTPEQLEMAVFLDAKCNEHLVLLRKTVDNMYGRRQPVTQIANLVIKTFTGFENTIDPKAKGTKGAEIQAWRDRLAKYMAEEKARLEREAQRKLALDKELITLKSECQRQLAFHFNDYLSGRIAKINELFNTLTLEIWESQSFTISHFENKYPYEQFQDSCTKINIRGVYASIEQIASVKAESTKGKFGEFSDEFTKKINEVKDSIIDRLASKKTELLQIADAKKRDADKVAEMERQAAERRAQEEEKLRKEEEERKAATENKINAGEQADLTNTLFESQQILSTAPQQAAQVRESYEIEVLNPLGYLLIAQFYFEREGKTESIAKLEKKTLSSMKKFCESYAMKNDEKISSPFLKYNEKFKTIAKR